MPGTRLLTFGHGTLRREELAALLLGAGIGRVVDVRRGPGSRRNPDVNREQMRRWLPEHGIGYRWEERLGGFRRPAPDSPDTVWRNPSFRGYAGHTRTPDFLAAMETVLAEAAGAAGAAAASEAPGNATAVMCSEGLWWRCHRRIIADFAVLARGADILHLLPDGRLVPHPPTEGARLRDDGLLVYDGRGPGGA